MAEKFLVIAVEILQDNSGVFFPEWDSDVRPQKCESFQEACDIKRELEKKDMIGEHAQVLIVPFEDIERVSRD